VVLCSLLAAGSVLAWWVPAVRLDWQPGLATVEPWRLVSAAWVHWSALHLGANLAAIGVVAMLGHAARLPGAAAVALALAWPLTHAGLAVQPALAHYGGASGVLHAGVAVAACWLVATQRGPARRIGVVIAGGLLIKVLVEEPWLGPLAHPRGWDIALAPLAHLSGALAGLGCAAVVLMARRLHRQSRHGS